MKDPRLELLNQWREELKIAVESQDLETFKAFYDRWTERGIYRPDIAAMIPDEVKEVSMKKLALQLSDIKPEIKTEATEWLLSRGYDLKID